MRVIIQLEILQAFSRYPEGTTKYRVARETSQNYHTVCRRVADYDKFGLLEFTGISNTVHGTILKQIYKLTENGRLLLQIFKNIH